VQAHDDAAHADDLAVPPGAFAGAMIARRRRSRPGGAHTPEHA
jgi:hypothetical protein